MDEITVAKRLSLSECGYSEHWLGTQIHDDPTILGIGATECLTREKLQSSGGRLDLLLKDDEDGMYEVELMLGPTDETHIIRCIEYWDLERKRWPNRSHTAVLVAEQINSRFYNVVRLLSNAVPIIGIAVGIVEVGGQKALDLVTIIDAFEEPEDGGVEEPETYDRQHWVDNYPWVLDMAAWVKGLLVPFYGTEGVGLKFLRDSIRVTVAGFNKMWLDRRKPDRALLVSRCNEVPDYQGVVSKMEELGVPVHASPKQKFYVNSSLQQLKEQEGAWKWLAPQLSPKNVLGKGGEGK